MSLAVRQNVVLSELLNTKYKPSGKSKNSQFYKWIGFYKGVQKRPCVVFHFLFFYF